MYILKRKVKFVALEFFFIIIFAGLSMLLLGFWYKLKIQEVRQIGKVKISDNISQLTTPLLILSICLFIAALLFAFRYIKEQTSLHFEIDGSNIIAKIKNKKYSFNVHDCSLLHLLRPVGSVEYGYRDTMAFLVDDKWFVLGPYLKSSKPISDIYSELLENYTAHKKAEAIQRFDSGDTLYFPYIVTTYPSGEINIKPQNAFDTTLYFDAYKGEQPVTAAYLPDNGIKLNKGYLFANGINIHLSDIDSIVFHSYKNSITRQSTIREWQKGKSMTFMDANNNFLTSISLPSLLNCDVFVSVMLDFVENVKYAN